MDCHPPRRSGWRALACPLEEVIRTCFTWARYEIRLHQPLGPPSKLHAEPPFPAAAALSPPWQPKLEGVPARNREHDFFPVAFPLAVFSWFHILHLTVVCHDSS